MNPGTRVDRYVLLWELGRGGMGTVWAAFDPRLDRKVALKLLLPGLSREDGTASTAQARLLREAQALARVTHPHTVTVFDVGTAGDQVYLAMEHLTGQTLKAWSKAKPRDWREVVRVMTQAARGLMAVHAAGLVHRDFKPGNVIITTQDTAKVLDFGLARAVKGVEPREAEAADAATPLEPELRAQEEAITAVGAVCGTPGHLAPELLDGQPSSPASDQFAFGVTLYRSLYGQRPLSHSMSPASVRAQLAQLAKRPPAGSDVPNWLHAVVLRSLAEQPEARFADMGALLAEVEQHTQRWSLARAWPVLTALVLAVGAVGAWAPWRRPPCPSEVELLHQTLPPDWRRALEARPGGKPPAHFLALADRTVATWARDSVQVCLDAHRAPPSVSTLQRRECLDRRGIALSTTLEVLGHADGAPAQSLDQVFEGTLERMSCDTPGQVARGSSDEVPLGLRAKARGLRTLLVRASALSLAGQGEAAQTLSTQAASEAADAGLQGFQAEALHVMASVELARGLEEPALRHAEQSMNLALAAGTDAQAVVSASQLALAMAHRADQLPMAKALVRTAAALSTRQGSPDDLESPLNYARMAIALADGDLDEGLRVAQRRLQLALSLHGEDSLSAQDAHDALGVAWWNLGNVKRATEETAAGIATAERTGRDLEPGLMSNYLNLAVGLRHTGRAADARRALEKGLIIAQTLATHDHQVAAETRAELADLLKVEDPPRALTLARAAEAFYAERPPSWSLGWTVLSLASVLTAQGQGHEALLQCRRAEAALAQSPDASGEVAWAVHQCWAEAHRSLGHWADARREYEALGRLKPSPQPDVRGAVHLGWAQTLRALRAPEAEVRALVELAEADYRAFPGYESELAEVASFFAVDAGRPAASGARAPPPAVR